MPSLVIIVLLVRKLQKVAFYSFQFILHTPRDSSQDFFSRIGEKSNNYEYLRKSYHIECFFISFKNLWLEISRSVPDM